jgi:hypothetical protein
MMTVPRERAMHAAAHLATICGVVQTLEVAFVRDTGENS